MYGWTNIHFYNISTYYRYTVLAPALAFRLYGQAITRANSKSHKVTVLKARHAIFSCYPQCLCDIVLVSLCLFLGQLAFFISFFKTACLFVTLNLSPSHPSIPFSLTTGARRENYYATSFWCNNDVNNASYSRWALSLFLSQHTHAHTHARANQRCCQRHCLMPCCLLLKIKDSWLLTPA